MGRHPEENDRRRDSIYLYLISSKGISTRLLFNADRNRSMRLSAFQFFHLAGNPNLFYTVASVLRSAGPLFVVALDFEEHDRRESIDQTD